MQLKKIIGIVGVALLIVGCGHNKAPLYNGNKYIVVMKRSAPVESLRALGREHDLPEADQEFSHAIHGAVYDLNEEKAKALAEDPQVAYVERDRIISIDSVQSAPTWGLDRLDQVSLPLNQTYTYIVDGSNVNAYIIDTGILLTHSEFQGRADSGFDFVDNDSDATDCNGHGTHVAGTIGSVTYGVAKNVRLHAVRVLDCSGSGSVSGVIAGIEWVTAHHVKPAVANMSLGGGVSQAIDDAVNASIQAGVTYAVAAGNENTSACNGSPARVPAAITVGASTNADVRASFSNYGNCVDLFAPGQDITSTWIGSNTATNTISGTSMATPHVVGVAALYLSAHPSASPIEVAAALVGGASPGRLSSIGTGSPNLLLNVGFLSGSTPPPPPVDPGAVALVSGVPVSGIATAKDGEKYFVIQVPAGSSVLTVEISGGTGDADLYVKANAKPTLSSFDCRPYLAGNAEACSIPNPSAGTYHIVVQAYSTFSNVSVKATVQAASPPNGGQHFTGELKSRGASFQTPQWVAGAGLTKIQLSGPIQADFDLYLYKLNGSTWTIVARSLGATSTESISYQGAAGTYRVGVVSYSGTGSFALDISKP